MKTFVVIVSMLTVIHAVGQVRTRTAKPGKSDSLIGHQLSPLEVSAEPAVGDLFELIEKGIQTGSTASFSENLGSQVLINIPGGENGYFSSNQGLSILQNYFAHRRPISFTFTRLNTRVPNPYATGRLSYFFKGNKEGAQIYVSLSPLQSKWVVSQFNIY